MISAPPVSPVDNGLRFDGDSQFTGFRSRQQGQTLPPGVASYAENMRMDRTEARVRAGSTAVVTDVTLTNEPVTLPFGLPGTLSVFSLTRTNVLPSGTRGNARTSALPPWGVGDSFTISGAVETDYNGTWTVLEVESDIGGYVTRFDLGGLSPTSPATGTITASFDGKEIYNSYSDEVFAEAVIADDQNNEGVLMALATRGLYARYGEDTASIAYPANETVEPADKADVLQAFGKVYLFRGSRTAPDLTISTLTQTTGTATCTTAAAHGLTTGDWVYITGCSPWGYNMVAQVTVTDTDEFTYAVDSGTASPATVMGTVRPCKIPLMWTGDVADDFVAVPNGGFATGTNTKMPPADWGLEFRGRMILPYSRDEVIVSDVYDADTYDTAWQQFQIRAGSNDWLMAVHPYQQYSLLVFFRKSVHLVDLSSEDLDVANVAEITRDIGCVARRSIVTCGNRILWLSDQGVHYLDISNELALRNSQKPLSDPIQDIIDRINWAYAQDIVAVYHDNRYYLAVPLDDDTTNRTVLVFNFLNGEWESVDHYPSSFDIHGFAVLGYNGQQRLHAVTSFGFMFRLEDGDVDQWGIPGSITDFTINGKLYTRDYTGGNLDRKRFVRVQLEGDATVADAFTADFVSTNPDATSRVLSYTANANTDFTLRQTLRNRGIAGGVQIETTAGRPSFRNIRVESVISDRTVVNQT